MFNNVKQFGSQGAAAAKMAMLQLKIKNKKIEVVTDNIKVTVTGDGKLKTLSIDGRDSNEVVKAVNDAISKAQAFAAEEMKGAMGDLSQLLGSLKK
jgi:DNA-binding protein YbaB